MEAAMRELSKIQQTCSTILDQIESWKNGALEIYQSLMTTKNHENNSISQLNQQQAANLKFKIKDLQTKFEQVIQYLSQHQQCLANSLIKYACDVNALVSNLCKEDLMEWKFEQKRASFGASAVPPTTALSNKFQELMSHGFYIWKSVEKLIKFHMDMEYVKTIQWNGTVNIEQMDQMRFKLLHNLLQSSFLVTIQPPLVVKNKLDLSVRMLSAKRELGLETLPAPISCCVISEEFATAFVQSPTNTTSSLATVGSINQRPKEMEFLEKEGVFGVNFKGIRVTVDSRRVQGRGSEAIRRKYHLLFRTEVRLPHDKGTKIFPLYTLSLPFVVSVHGTQDMELWATILWDTAFSADCGSAVPLKGVQSVPWSRVSEALQGVFRMISSTNRGLTSDDLQYLKERFFLGKCDIRDNPDPSVNWSRFFLEPVQGSAVPEKRLSCSFSFWQWFFHIADMLQERPAHRTLVKVLWEDRLIHGFVRREDCREMLVSLDDAAFLVRFSDNQLGALSVVYRVPNTTEVEHLKPFRQKDLIEKLGFPKIIESLDQLNDVDIVYSNRPKSEIISRVPQTQTTDSVSFDGGYIPFTLTLGTSNGRRSPRTHSNASDPGTPVLSSPVFSNATLSSFNSFHPQGYSENNQLSVFDYGSAQMDDDGLMDDSQRMNGIRNIPMENPVMSDVGLNNFLDYLSNMDEQMGQAFDQTDPLSSMNIENNDDFQEYFPNYQS